MAKSFKKEVKKNLDFEVLSKTWREYMRMTIQDEPERFKKHDFEKEALEHLIESVIFPEIHESIEETTKEDYEWLKQKLIESWSNKKWRRYWSRLEDEAEELLEEEAEYNKNPFGFHGVSQSDFHNPRR